MRKNKQKNKKKFKCESIEDVVKNTLHSEKFDTYGSYTGWSEDGKTPVQDADDL